MNSNPTSLATTDKAPFRRRMYDDNNKGNLNQTHRFVTRSSGVVATHPLVAHLNSASSTIPSKLHLLVDGQRRSFDNASNWFEQQKRRLQQQTQAAHLPQLPNPCESVAIASGIVSFGSTLALSTWTQGRMLHISTGTSGPVPSILGFATVCIASIASHHIATTVHNNYDTVFDGIGTNDKYNLRRSLSLGWNGSSSKIQEMCKSKLSELSSSIQQQSSRLRNANLKDFNFSIRRTRDDFDYDRYLQVPVQTIRICCVGLIIFKMLGGRFWAIAPSSYTHIGSFGHKIASVPATERYATASERVVIEKLGKKFGCHTCGSRMIGSLFRPSTVNTQRSTIKFVSDHMPPKAVAEQINSKWYRKLIGSEVSYRFYPQCIHCSTKQGNLLSKATQELRRYQLSSILLRKGPILDLSQAGAGANAYIHGFRPRIYYLTGGILGAIATYRTTSQNKRNNKRQQQVQKEVDKKQSERYEQIQQFGMGFLSTTKSFIKNSIEVLSTQRPKKD